MSETPSPPDLIAPASARRATVAFAGALALCVVAIAILAVAWPPDGNKHGGDGWRFAGRLHPLLVHLPIGLLLLVPVLELAGVPRRARHLRQSAGLVLGLGAVASVVAAAHGYVLARFDGIGGTGLTWHLWAGATTAALASLAVALRPTSAIAYGVALAALVATLAFAGHLGGQLTYGDAYLSEVAPRPIARLLGPVADDSPEPPVATRSETAPPVVAPSPATAPATMPAAAPTIGGPVTFAGTIAPMFAESCVSCHGPAKAKGGLRLDSYAALIAGGESGAELVAGNALASDLYHRMTLPPEHDDAMPPENARHRPTVAQVEAVKRWIADGAKG